MAETSNDRNDYAPGGRLDPDAQDIAPAEQERRRAERDRLDSEAGQGEGGSNRG